ncbi:hypothetical protein [Streptomyces cinnamoneus]|uniref:Uncharacterized protein n=1 Tax=Streptomyces cinnamoneus TaxID=53446 RepID=A0A918WFT1_STRCJ|nr:hypothetical protein [Streptomyces cinnamoneus]GHC43388.1 hypothetical protein GCM10010507_17870 [Streptomyces cinnamoneus]
MEEPTRGQERERAAGAPDTPARARRADRDDHSGRHHTGDEDESESHIVRGVD